MNAETNEEQEFPDNPENLDPTRPGQEKYYRGLVIRMEAEGVFYVVNDDNDNIQVLDTVARAEEWIDGFWDEEYAGVRVREAIDMKVWAKLHPEIAEIEAYSVCGLAIVQLLNSISHTLRIVELEPSIRALLIKEGLHQSNVWYFG
ncbi:hypothetical protein [Paraburkholderia sp. SIMBA_054]|uniref:hypothetical protein n=1 Tax=Paraburkholderia sp. SIMBA_054 TaxID=3085795 RepID=UPI003979F7E7